MRTTRALLLLPLLAACASAGRLGDPAGSFDRSPYYAGRATAAPVAALPIAWQRGAEQPVSFEPEARAGAPAALLLAEMQAYLDSLVDGPMRSITAGTPPDVRFGCERDPGSDCGEEAGAPRRHAISVVRGSAPWRAALGGALAATGTGARHAIVVTLEIGDWWPTQVNLRGDKVVDLGAGRRQPLPWLTSLDDPVSVLQVTGALVDSTGAIVRIGAEGILAKRTPFLGSVLGVQALVTDDDLQRLRAEPDTWRAALRALVRGLRGGDGRRQPA